MLLNIVNMLKDVIKLLDALHEKVDRLEEKVNVFHNELCGGPRDEKVSSTRDDSVRPY